MSKIGYQETPYGAGRMDHDSGEGYDNPFEIGSSDWLEYQTGYNDAEINHLEEVDESMDGDHESALASAGFGTDEDYGYFGSEEF